MTSPTDPVNARPRVDLIDALRGFALLGVIVANVLAQSGFNPFQHPEHVAAVVDREVFRAISIFGDGRFMALFSILFGIGFGLQVQRAADRGEPLMPRYARRLLVLAAIGLFHHVFLSAGDILIDYAIFGVILLAFVAASSRTILIAATACLFLPLMARLLIDGLQIQRPPPIDPAVVTRMVAERDYFGRVAFHWSSLSREWWVFTRFNSAYLALFLLGLFLVRSRVLLEPGRHLRTLTRVFLVSALVAIALVAGGAQLQAPLSRLPGAWSGGLANVSATTGTFAQAIAYGSGFVLLWERHARIAKRLRTLRYLGRMALTNYLAVSAFGTIVFFGGGLLGTVRPAFAVGVGLILCVALHVGARWWLSRYHMGPIEWIWRALAFGKAPEWRVSSHRSARVTA